MQYNLYLIVAVALRVFGLVVVIVGLTLAVLTLPFTASIPSGAVLAGAYAVFPSAIGFVLWFVSKPVARAVTTNL